MKINELARKYGRTIKVVAAKVNQFKREGKLTIDDAYGEGKYMLLSSKAVKMIGAFYDPKNHDYFYVATDIYSMLRKSKNYINNRISELKRQGKLIRDKDYIRASNNKYYYTNEAFDIIEKRFTPQEETKTHTGVLKYLDNMPSFAKMDTKQKERWMNFIGLTNKFKQLLSA